MVFVHTHDESVCEPSARMFHFILLQELANSEGLADDTSEEINTDISSSSSSSSSSGEVSWAAWDFAGMHGTACAILAHA